MAETTIPESRRYLGKDKLKTVLTNIKEKLDGKVDKVSGKGLSTNDLTTELLNKLNSLENYDDTDVRNLIKGISSRIDTLVGESASEAIDNFNEILAFLNGVTDTQTLQGLLSNIKAEFERLLANKVDKVSGKQLSTNDYTTAEKTKLSGIEEGANNYSLPTASGTTLGGVKTGSNITNTSGTISLTKANVTGALGYTPPTQDTTYGVATKSANGLMSSTDKTKLDGVETGAQKNTVTGIKGNAESSYRTGNVNITPANIGAAAASHTHSAGDITSGTLSIDRIANGSITKEKLADGVLDNSDILISTIYIDQTISDPASMISGDINGAAIQAIRANSHRYLGKYTAENTMTICQLNDANSNQYADGSAAVLTGAEGDVFMRLPYFYTKATELVEDKWRIDFAFGGQPDGERWKQWGGDDLIGVYEAYHTNSKIYSRSGVTPSVSISQADFKTYTRNRGTGFTLVKYKYRNIMAFLFFAIYGNTNSQAICGFGTNDAAKTTGATNSLGMTDTTTANGNAMSINYWGLENWWGDLYEFIDNVTIDGNNVTIYEDGETREIKIPFMTDGYKKFISKILIGGFLDILPKSIEGSSTTGYCDAYMNTGNANVLVCSDYADLNTAGTTFLEFSTTDTSPSHVCTSRLCFYGNIIEMKSTSAFKSLTAIG